MRPLATVALCASLCAALALPARAEVVVLLPIDGEQPELPGELRRALATIPGVAIQAAEATGESLAAAKALGLSCNAAAPSCMAELGGLANAELVVGGALAAASDGTLIRLQLVDVTSGRERRSTTLLVADAGAGRARALRLLAVRLLAPERERGELTVRARPAGALIGVDGFPRGKAPLGAPLELVPGRHEVYVAFPGYVSVSQPVDVAFDAAAVLEVDLVRDDSFADAPARGADDRGQDGGDDPLQPPCRVAITSMEAHGVPNQLSRAVAAALAEELVKLEATTVFRLDEVPALLAPETALMLACREAACSRLLAAELDVDTLIHVDLSVDKRRSQLVVRRIDRDSGEMLMQSDRAVSLGDAEEISVAAAAAVRTVFADRRLRRSAAGRRDGNGMNGGLPRWVFFTSLAATGTAAAAAGGLLLWSSLERDAETRSALELSMWIAVGTTAVLGAADVATGLTTAW